MAETATISEAVFSWHRQLLEAMSNVLAYTPVAALATVSVLALGSLGLSLPWMPVEVHVRAREDLRSLVDDTTTLTPEQYRASLPVPGTASNIGPGSHLLITIQGDLFGCTANYVWTNATKTFLGAAGHCFLPEGTTATHGPGADFIAASDVVRVCVSGCDFGGETGFIIQGTTVTLGPVAYARQTQAGVDIGNDFGVVEIPSAVASTVRPSMPVWGGPITVSTLKLGDIACHYGNGVAVGEVFPTMARSGVGIGSNAKSWSADLAAAPGDSGSAVNICVADTPNALHGRGAVGILTHLTLGTSVTVGTTVAQAEAMATQAGLTLVPTMGT